MIIYYTNKYDKTIMDSHRLLENAIALHTCDAEKAADLVSKLCQSTEYGKPAIPDFADFSITHSDNYWAVLINDGCCEGGTDETIDRISEVCGIDIQFEKSGNYKTVCCKYYTDEERSLVELSGKSEFYRLWARREALVKAVGTTIVNRNLPAVAKDRVEFEGVDWMIQDVIIPGTVDEAHAAICYRADSPDVQGTVSCDAEHTMMPKEVRYVEIRN